MKFYEFIESLQSLNPNKIIMIKTGAFFNSIGRDAIILEYTIGLKRSCFAKGLCKVGFPVAYVRNNLEEIKKRLKDKNLGIIIYDEVENGRYKFKNKSYDIILELNGDEIEETRKNTDCNECKKNVYGKVTNRYTIRKEDYEKLAKKVEDFLNSIKEILKIKYYVRYQDDFLLFHESKKYLQECLISLQDFLKKEKLELNKKTRIYSNNENFIFLGRKNDKNYANYRRIKGKIKKKYYLFQKEKTSLYSLMSSINSFYTLDRKYTEKCLEKFR